MTELPHQSNGAATCLKCSAPAAVCQECMRALALMWFGGIARHPEAGTDCRLCEAGFAAYCGSCLVMEVISYRASLREGGHDIGVGRDV